MTSDATSDATSDTTRTDSTAAETERLRELINGARCVLFDFDGPICRLFAGYSARNIAQEMVGWLARQGLQGLLTEQERAHPDPQFVLRTLDERQPDSDLVDALKDMLTREELKAVPSAWPTPYADPVIRTWDARGARLAVTTNNAADTVHRYLQSRELVDCFAPHIYGRTQELHQQKPDPYHLNRALRAMGSDSKSALMIGDTADDLEAARRAGVPFLGYGSTDRKEKLLREAGAQTVVRSLDSVLRVLREKA